MQSFWGFSKGHYVPKQRRNIPPGYYDHYYLSDIGVNTHQQIDNHITSTTDPHGTTWTQDTLNTTHIGPDPPGDPMTVGAFTTGTNSISAPSTPGFVQLTNSNGIRLAPTGDTSATGGRTITGFYYEVISATPTVYPWSTAGGPGVIYFTFIRIGRDCICNIDGGRNVVTAPGNFIQVPSIVPAEIRPSSTTSYPITVLDQGNPIIAGGVQIQTNGTLTFTTKYGTMDGFIGSGVIGGLVRSCFSWKI